MSSSIKSGESVAIDRSERLFSLGRTCARHRQSESKEWTNSTVIFVNRLFYPEESATSQLLTDLAMHLSEAGLRVVVIASRSSGPNSDPLPKRELFGGIEIRRVWCVRASGRSLASRVLRYVSFYPGAFLELLKVCRKGDLMIAKTDPPLVSIVALAATKIRGAQLINWIQDLYPEVAIELRTPLVSGSLGRALASFRNLALRHAVMNVAIGSTMAKRLNSLGVPSSRTTVVQNWADEETVRPLDRSFARRKWGFADSDFVVGYSGNLGQAHEIETLVGAAKILRGRPEVKFLFIGGGHQHQRLNDLIAKEGLTNFLFKPHQPRQQLGDSLAAADVHWVSLRPRLEGLIVPSKLYGILAAGRPVLSVCDANGEVSRIVRDHNCGLIVEPGDSLALAAAISSLMDDPELSAELGRRARLASEQSFARSSALHAWSQLIASLSRVQARDTQVALSS